MYYNGEGTEKDYKKAYTLYKKACDQGNTLACNNLGIMYDNGQGVEKTTLKL